MNRVTSLAVQYLKGKLGDMSDTYTLALIAYAFELADDSAKEIALEKLMKKVIKEGKFHRLYFYEKSIYSTKKSIKLTIYNKFNCGSSCLTCFTLDGTLHWEQDSSGQTGTSPWLRPYYRPRSADIEITSYVLLTYAHKKDIQIGLPISQWLAQQRNSLGGYSSTQVGLPENTDLYGHRYCTTSDCTYRTSIFQGIKVSLSGC